MPKLENHPGASSYADRHGRTRYRYRRSGRTVALPSSGPGQSDFEEAYTAAVEGRERKPVVVDHPNAVVPRSFRAAWNGYRRDAQWLGFDPATRSQHTHHIEAWLTAQIAPSAKATWGDVPVAHMRHRHIKDILNGRANTPHAAKHWLTALRKLLLYALDMDWIEADPSVRIKWSPSTTGWRAWTPRELDMFLRRWPAGTTPHLVFCLALWMGNRRSDVARLRKDARVIKSVRMNGETRIVPGFEFTQKKGGKTLFLPEAPMLRDAIKAMPDHDGPTILVTAHGKAFSDKSLTGRMADWTHSAGMEKGATLHGLRKTLGKLIAEGSGTTRQLMDVLGHSNMAHAELYSRDAEQAALAVAGMDAAIATFGGMTTDG